MTQVFISYKRVDEIFARRLAYDLRAAGFAVWLDVLSIAHGKRWSQEIAKGLKSSDVMVVIITPESMAATQVADEWGWFLDKHRPVIPLLLRQAEIHYRLSSIQYIDFRGQPYETAFAQLQERLTNAVSPEMTDSGAWKPLPDANASTARDSAALNVPSSTIGALLGVALVVLLLAYGVMGVMDAVQGDEGDGGGVTLSALEAAQNRAQTFSGSNGDWKPFVQEYGTVEMVLVPAGCFDMGADDLDRAGPVHRVCFDEPFWIDKTEVSNAQFAALGGTAGRSAEFPASDHPRENITWDEASAYCTSRGARLPTEAEWEYAARGVDALPYPWGDKWDDRRVVDYRDGGESSAAVGSLAADQSWVGALDMGGNVREWVADWSGEGPYAALPDGAVDPQGPDTGEARVLRGGAWQAFTSDMFLSAYRSEMRPASWNNDVGFRCVRSN